MVAGIRIVGDSGNVLIDSEVGVNYCINRKGSVVCNTSAGGSYPARYADIVVPAQRPMFAFRSDSYVLPGLIKNNGDGTWTQRVWGPQGATVDYFVLDYPPSSSTVGLKLYNSQGVCTFDAMRRNPDVVYFGSTTSGKTDLAASTYAVLFVQVGSFMNPGAPSGQNYQFYNFARTVSTGFQVVANPLFLWPNNISMANSLNPIFILIDISQIESY